MALNTTPRTWTAGEVPTAAMFNAELRDALTALQAPWDTYTVAWTASTTNPTLGNGSLIGRYRQVGKTVDVLILLTWGSTTAGGSGNWQFSLPVAPKTGIGSTLHVAAASSNATANSWLGFTRALAGSTTNDLWYPNQSQAGDWSVVTGAAPPGWASGDTVRVFGRYEAA